MTSTEVLSYSIRFGLVLAELWIWDNVANYQLGGETVHYDLIMVAVTHCAGCAQLAVHGDPGSVATVWEHLPGH